MKTSERILNDVRLQHTEAIIARHMGALFHRLPMLTGFLLQPDLEVAELSIFSWPGYTAVHDLHDEVMQSLVDLAAERPEAVQLMVGRTFARAVH
jgi:hypothetical protein